MPDEEPTRKGALIGGKKKLFKVGGSTVIALPKDWLEQHGYGPGTEVQVLANRDLAILSPKSAEEYYQTGSELVARSREEAGLGQEKRKQQRKEAEK